jgi:hypothetical protein
VGALANDNLYERSITEKTSDLGHEKKNPKYPELNSCEKESEDSFSFA